jgi:hypothetical protein
MELDEFVQRSIEKIILGVEKAGKFADDHQARITERTTKIEFDVAVTVASGREANIGEGISIAGFDLGAKGNPT